MSESQFLTITYNPCSHPNEIYLLDINGQPIAYRLIPSNNPNMLNTNVCSICGGQAVDKCWYGTVNGTPCGRLLCLTHLMELPSARGGRYPHCPQHYHFIKTNAICTLF